MNFFRRMLGSKIGGIIAVGTLAVIALAFVLGDITGSGGMHLFGPASGEIAKIGNKTLTVNDLQTRSQMVFERMREKNPELTIDQFIADGSVRRVADELIASRALIAYGEKHGMRVSKALVDAQIASNPAFVDATGNFSEAVFRQMLAQRRVAEKDLRDDIVAQIIQDHMLAPVGAGVKTPENMVPPFAAMLLEERNGEMFAIPSAAFAPPAAPGDNELQAFFRANASQFAVPEQRKLRYALIDLARFEKGAAPTDAELAQAYKAKADQYRARQSRDLSQLILSTESAAKDVASKVRQGQSLQDAAKGLGLSATRIDGADQTQLAGQTSAEIAKAAFAAIKGAVIGPIKAPLGWTVLRLDEIREVPGKTLEQAKAELTAEIRTAKQKQLFSEFVNELDGKLGEGVSLSELAKTYQLTLVETPLITKGGIALKDPQFKADAAVTALLNPGFSMSADDDAQIVSIKPDELAAVVAVNDVIPSGPPPYAEVKAAVQVAWGLSKGSEKAKQLATQLAGELGRGTDAAATLAKLGLSQVERRPITARRADIAQKDGKVAPPLQALFTLNVGAARMLPLENNQGFIVVRLDKITPKDPREVPALMASTRAGLSNVFGTEYARQFMSAVRKELGVTINQEAIASVEKALRQANGVATQ